MELYGGIGSSRTRGKWQQQGEEGLGTRVGFKSGAKYGEVVWSDLAGVCEDRCQEGLGMASWARPAQMDDKGNACRMLLGCKEMGAGRSALVGHGVGTLKVWNECGLL
jgi:hypothetical protein